MKKSIHLILIIILASVLYGCKSDSLYQEPRFWHQKSVKFEALTNNLEFNVVNDLYIYDKYAIIVAWDGFTSSYIHVYDKETGKHIRSGLGKGRGPNETLMGHLNSSFDAEKGEVVMYDFSKKAIIRCNIPKFIGGEFGAIYWEERHSKYNFANTVPLKDGKVLFINNFSPYSMYEECYRFICADGMGNEIYKFDKFPFEENSWLRYNLYNNMEYAVTDNRDKLAIFTHYGLIAETFGLSDDSIREIATKYYIEPTIGNEKEPDYKGAILCVGDVYATDSAIYCAYDGEHYLGSAPRRLYTKNIAVFDWNGNAKTLYKTNMRVECICYDENSSKLYAVIEDALEGIFLARIDI